MSKKSKKNITIKVETDKVKDIKKASRSIPIKSQKVIDDKMVYKRDKKIPPEE